MNSYWLSSIKKNEIEKQIDNNYIADVCIVGAGITGLSTAYYLAKNGLKVIIVDKSRIGEKTSGHTTAKITLQHGLIYDYLINTYGYNFALNYFYANEKAISEYPGSNGTVLLKFIQFPFCYVLYPKKRIKNYCNNIKI